MTTDDFTTAAQKSAERAHPGHRSALPGDAVLNLVDAHVAGWEVARDHLAAQVPQVTIRTEEGKPATCEVRQGGVLIFAGRDYSADMRVAAQEPTDAEPDALRAKEEQLRDLTATDEMSAAARAKMVELWGWAYEDAVMKPVIAAALAARRDEEKR